MISRKTIFSLLLALLLAGGLRAWTIEHPDNCARFNAGDHALPPSEYVESGTRTVEVPCQYWVPRQTALVQCLLVVELALVGLFLISALTDVRRRQRELRALRAARYGD